MNKPVAWMNKDVTNWLSCTNQHPETKINEWIPLYTHLAELTDEEIEIIAENCWKTDEDLQFFDYNKFAKAILRKAQDK